MEPIDTFRVMDTDGKVLDPALEPEVNRGENFLLLLAGGKKINSFRVLTVWDSRGKNREMERIQCVERATHPSGADVDDVTHTCSCLPSLS